MKLVIKGVKYLINLVVFIYLGLWQAKLLYIPGG